MDKTRYIELTREVNEFKRQLIILDSTNRIENKTISDIKCRLIIILQEIKSAPIRISKLQIVPL